MEATSGEKEDVVGSNIYWRTRQLEECDDQQKEKMTQLEEVAATIG